MDAVRIRRQRWFPFQPLGTVMAPCGHIHFHPGCDRYSDDFAQEPPLRAALFVHEMAHVWQAQHRGRYWLPLMRHPFCRYDYELEDGKPLERYGIEQQAEIIAHGWLALIGVPVPGGRPADRLITLLPSVQQRTR